MELVTCHRYLRRGRLLVTVTHVFSIDYVAKLLDEDAELRQAIVRNVDNLSYGSSISVYTGPDDEAITSLTCDGIEELQQVLVHARSTSDEWSDFLDAFVDDEELIARIKPKSPRNNRAVTHWPRWSSHCNLYAAWRW